MLAASVPAGANHPVPRARFLLTDSVGGGAPTHDFIYRYPDEIPFGADWANDGKDWIVTAEPESRTWEWYYSDLSGLDSAKIDPDKGINDYRNFEYFVYGKAELGHWPVIGDWDNANAVGGRTVDRNRDTPGIAEPKDGRWRWKLSNLNDGPRAPDIPPFTYGSLKTDIPVSGDWDGNGFDTIGVVRRLSNGRLLWLLKDHNSAGPPDYNFVYGNWMLGDWPIVGAWEQEEEGLFDMPGLVRPNSRNGHWVWLLRCEFSSGPPEMKFEYGSTSVDTAFAGDWNGDGISTPGVSRYVRP